MAKEISLVSFNATWQKRNGELDHFSSEHGKRDMENWIAFHQNMAKETWRTRSLFIRTWQKRHRELDHFSSEHGKRDIEN